MAKKDKNFGLRLKKCRRVKDMTQDDVHHATGLALSSIRNHESGILPNHNTLEKYIDLYGCNRDWLLTGIGHDYKYPLAALPGADSSLKDQVTRKPDDIDLIAAEEAVILKNNFSLIRMADAKLSAGDGLEPTEGFGQAYAFRTDWLRFRVTSIDRAVMVRVSGDSMSPIISDNDIVMIDTGRVDFRPGNIYAIGMGDMIVVKKLDITHNGKIKIISINTTANTYEINPDEIRIIGQVIWVGKDLARPRI